MVNMLNHTVERTVDESNVSRFLPSVIKNRLFQGDEPSMPVGHKFKRVAMTTARKSVNSIKKLRESLFSSKEEIQFDANTVFSEPEAKPLEDTLSKEYYVHEQRTRTLVASIIDDTTNLVQDAFIEVGATKVMVDDKFKRRLIDEFIQDNLTSWTAIHIKLDDEKNKGRLRAMMWHHVCVQFPNHSRPFSSIRSLLADSFFHGICIIAKVMTSPSSSIIASVHDIRLFEYKAFRDLWKKALRSS
jgi:hypothetical protein